MYVCMYVCIYVCMYVCMYVGMYVLCMYVCMYVCMCVCVCMYVCKYICMYVLQAVAYYTGQIDRNYCINNKRVITALNVYTQPLTPLIMCRFDRRHGRNILSVAAVWRIQCIV
jgi:hypothetical protein